MCEGLVYQLTHFMLVMKKGQHLLFSNAVQTVDKNYYLDYLVVLH